MQGSAWERGQSVPVYGSGSEVNQNSCMEFLVLQISSFETRNVVLADEDTSLVLPCWIASVAYDAAGFSHMTYYIVIVLANSSRSRDTPTARRPGRDQPEHTRHVFHYWTNVKLYTPRVAAIFQLGIKPCSPTLHGLSPFQIPTQPT